MILNKEKYLHYISYAWWFAISTIFLIYPALQNGFPLLHPDSGTYIYVGFLDHVPVSRPITYCWLVRHISMSYTLWFVIIFQGLIVTSFINMLIYSIFRTKYSFFLSFILIALLSLFTGTPVYISHIMPDIFLSVAFLGIFLIFILKKIHWIWLILISSITIYAIIVHFSNIPIITGTVVALVVLFLAFRRYKLVKIYPKRLIVVGAVLAIAWLSIPSINASYGIGFRYSRVSNIIYTARLIPSGIFADYVEEKCESDTSFFLCEYQNTIPNYVFYHYFLWHDTSFLYQDECKGNYGFADCWIAKDSIYGTMIDDIFKTPKYRKRFLNDVVNQYLKQLQSFYLSSNSPFGEDSHINYPIKAYFSRDRNDHLNAKQQGHVIHYHARNFIQKVFVLLSLAIIILFFALKNLRKTISDKVKTLAIFIFLLFLANAGLISIVSIVTGRFEGRIIWLLPTLAFILVSEYYLKKYQITKIETEEVNKK